MRAPELFYSGHAYSSVTVSVDPLGARAAEELQTSSVAATAAPTGDVSISVTVPVIGQEVTVSVGSVSVDAIAPPATVVPHGNGRLWMANQPRAFWRTFREIATSSDIATFFNRYGDPDNRVRDINTNNWNTYQRMLGDAAKAWDPVDENGISHPTNDLERLNEARRFLSLHDFRLNDVELVQDLDTGGVVPKVKTLISYMAVSASMMLEAASPMKRCAHCSHWFRFLDIRAQFCTVACRNLAHRRLMKEDRR